MTEGPAHGNDLAFVMESVGQNMMQDKGGGADGSVSVGEMKVYIEVELLIGEG